MLDGQKKAEDRDDSTLLEAIYKQTSDAIFVVTKEGYVRQANPAALQLTGYAAPELIGQISFCQVCRGMATCSEEASCLDCFAHQMKMPSFEMKIRTKTGREFPVAASSVRLSGGEEGLVVIVRDMTEQHRTERERFQRMMTHYVIQAQEAERKRISRELHDNVGQTLYSLLVGLRVIDQLPIDAAVKEHLLEVQRMTAHTLEEVKNMAVEMRPSALDDLGLLPAIRSLIKRFDQTFGIEVELEVFGQKRRYSAAMETALYRICQEAMSNVAKYADTDQIKIRLSDLADRVELDIQDQGRGFDLQHITVLGTGLGLYGMRERANLLGGDVEITSAPGLGTKVHVVIPIDEKGEPLHVHSNFDRR